MERDSTRMQRLARAPHVLAMALGLVMSGGAGSALADAEGVPALHDGTIGYVLTDRWWAVYETEGGKKECPHGFNDGPREQFKKLFPENGTERTVLETQLKREGEQWHPETLPPEKFPFYEAQGKTSLGLNLDGKVGANDFTSPEGEQGIDNQLYRVIGCIANYRAAGTIYHFENEYMRRYNDNRVLLELTGVDDLVNDPEVTVTTYRGMDELLTDATGNDVIPGGTQRIDMRWGKQFIQRFKGKITDGVLTTEAADTFMIPWGVTFDTNGYQLFRGLQFKLKLTPDGAEGLMAGYVDIKAFNHHLNTSWSTHHQSYGQLSSPSEYQAMHRLADGYPDPKTGKNTAISSAVKVKFAQAFIQHPSKEMLSRRD